MDRRQVEKMSQAADRITEAVKEFSWNLNRFLEYQQELDRRREEHDEGYPSGHQWPGEPWGLRREPLPRLNEGDAVILALRLSQEVREEMGHRAEPEQKLPTHSRAS